LSLPGDRRITGTISSLSQLAIYGQGANSGQQIYVDTNDSGHGITSIWPNDDRIYVSRVLWPSLIVHVVGDGTIRGDGVDCGVSCTAEIRYDTPIVLTATANGATPFSGWSGACSGTQSCSVAITTTTHVTATFGSTSSTPTPTPTATPATATSVPPSPTPTATPATATSVPPSPTPTATPATAYVSPSYGPPTTSTVSIISPAGGLTGAKRVSVNGVKMFHVVRSDNKIDFTMKAVVAVAGTTVDVVLVKADNTVMTFTQSFTFEEPTTVTGTTASGAVLTTTSGVTVTVPPQTSLRPAAPQIAGSIVITYAQVDTPAEPPGDVPLSFFEVSMDVDGVGVITLTNPATLELPVDAAMVPPGQRPWLYEWITEEERGERSEEREEESDALTSHSSSLISLSSGRWSVVPNQTYDPATGLVTAPTNRLGTYALVTASMRWNYFPTLMITDAPLR
jgi:hypothetical protein